MERREFMLGVVPAIAGLAAAGQSIGGADGAMDVVEAFGFVPDGRTDNYLAFHRWAAHVNRVGGGSYVFPAGTYYVHQFRSSARSGPIRNAALSNCDGLSISGIGARIRLNGAFHRGAGETAARGTFMPFALDGCRNVRIIGFEIDGGVEQMTRDSSAAEVYSHLIALHGCSDVLLDRLHLHHSQTDGIYLANGGGAPGRPSRPCRDVRLTRVKVHNNARGGLAAIQVYGLTCTDCTFDENGYGLGRYEGHAPRFGVTVEPDYWAPGEVETRSGNLEFRRCGFHGNATAISGAYRERVQGYLRVIDCTSSNPHGSMYHMTLNWPGALIQGGRHDCGAGTIWTSWHHQTGGDVTIRDCEIRTSGQYGIFHAFPGNLLRMSGVSIVGTHRAPPSTGWVLSVQGDPGGGRRNSVTNCKLFVPAARKSRAYPYDYAVSFHHTVSENNLFRTDLPASGGAHFCTEYGPRATARGDRYQGTAPGPADSFRPGHGAAHDTRTPFNLG